jgi:phosphoglycolate phosphatase
MTMTPPLLVLDLDGTLVDTADDLIATLNRILTGEGLAAVTRADAGALLGAGARAMIERGFTLNRAPLDGATLDRLFSRFIPLYAEAIAVHSRPFEGAVAALDRFEAAGWRLAVCTNKLEGLSLRLLDELGLTPRFAAVCGGDTFPVRKPDAAHLLGTIARAGGSRERTVMVGDSRTDIDAARNAEVPVVAVTFGYTDTPVAELGPDAVIDRFDQLFEAVAAVTAGRI